MFDPDLFILMSDPESGGATLTAIGIDRFSAVWTIESLDEQQEHFYLQREAENILRALLRWIGQKHKQAQMRD